MKVFYIITPQLTQLYKWVPGCRQSDLVSARNCCMARMLPGEVKLVLEWTGLPGAGGGAKCKVLWAVQQTGYCAIWQHTFFASLTQSILFQINIHSFIQVYTLTKSLCSHNYLIHTIASPLHIDCSMTLLMIMSTNVLPSFRVVTLHSLTELLATTMQSSF